MLLLVFSLLGGALDGIETKPATAPAHVPLEIDPLTGTFVTLFLLGLNFFFVAAEFALVAVRRSRVEELATKGSRRARALRTMLDDLDRTIAGTQVGITLANVGLGIVAEPFLARGFLAILRFLPAGIGDAVSHGLAVVIAFVVITIVTVVIGEFVPKALALRYAERMALALVRPMQIIGYVLGPIVFLVNGLGTLVLKMLRLPPPKSHSITPDELRYVVEQAEESGVMREHEADVVRGALRFPNTLVRQVMVHRKDVEAFDVEIAGEELYQAAAKARHSRVPVYRGDLDKIVGILHVKELLARERSGFDLATILRPPLWVTADTPIPDLVTALRRKRTRLALVTDEFGGFFGLVTLEDAAEVVLGEVLDEHEMPRAPIPKDPDGRLAMQGSTRLLDLQEALDHEFEEKAVTVGGFLMRFLGRLPEPGEKILVEGYEFEVESISGTQIGKVRCAPPAREEPHEDLEKEN
jgi:CBS domain containing-hemolysin-like protein